MMIRNAISNMLNMLNVKRFLAQRFVAQWAPGFLLFGLAIGTLLPVACSDAGILDAIEDAEELSDGNLNNHIFVHSIVQIGETVYLGSKYVWEKTASEGNWKKTSLPSGLDPDKTPVVSIATDDKKLFVASREKVYVRDTNSWSAPAWPGGHLAWYALRGSSNVGKPGGEVLAVDTDKNIYKYSDPSWEDILTNTPMNDFVQIGSDSNKQYYLAAGSGIKTGKDLKNLSTTIQPPKFESSQSITDLLELEFNKQSQLAVLTDDGELYIYENSSWDDTGSGGKNNISLCQVDDKLLVGRVGERHRGGGYQIYDVQDKSWKKPSKTDDFTDMDSLVTLSSGRSIMNSKLHIIFFYDDPNGDDSRDRIYAATQGSRGVFGARRKAGRWSWGLE